MLRVVSTGTPAWWGAGRTSQSYLTTLRPRRGGLDQVGQVGGLGRGERVYAVRMIGDTGYVVTFKQVDPLYTLDLDDPAHPQRARRARPPRLLVLPASDLGRPAARDRPERRRADERAERHAGLALRRLRPAPPDPPARRRRSAGAGRRPSPTTTPSSTGRRPASSSSRSASRRSRCTSRARRASPSSAGSFTRQAQQSQLPQIDRSLVVGNTLLTVSSAGVASNGLTTLARLGWAAFPAAPPPAPVPQPLPRP